MSALQELIRDQFVSEPFDAEAIAKEVWRQLEVEGSLADLLFPLLRNEVVRLRRERSRDLGQATFAETMAKMPLPKLPAARKVDPHETIKSIRAGLADSLRRLIEEGELQFSGRTVAMRDATENDIDDKLAQEQARLEGQHQSVMVLRQLKSYFSLGITRLGELL